MITSRKNAPRTENRPGQNERERICIGGKYEWFCSACRQFLPQLAARFLSTVIRRFIGDQAFILNEMGVGVLTAGKPVPHPLTATPAVGTEESDLSATPAAFAPSAIRLTMASVLPVPLQ